MPYTVVDKGSKYFNTVLYTGDGTTSRSITGVGFKPDFTWIKSRSNAYYHELYDAVRGFSSTTNGRVLYSNTTSAEGTPNTFNSFNTDGFTVSNQSGEVGTNGSGATFVSWNWLGSNTTVSNTSGSITSTVSANTTSGFSVVRWSGSGANATVGHGIGTAPKMIIIKNYDANLNDWVVYHSSIGNGAFLRLNTTNASQSATNIWNSTSPTSSVFSLGTAGGSNGSGTNNLIAYCFAEVKGYSKFGSYTGNGSADGTFIYTGFKPAFIITKCSSASGEWEIYDNKRTTYNVATSTLEAQSNSAELNYYSIDMLSNGFKQRQSYNTQNQSGATYIYMAFSENPFCSSKGIPTTAR